MAKVQYLGTGRRKKSIARVRLSPGTGSVVINKRDRLYAFLEKTSRYCRAYTFAAACHNGNLALQSLG